MAPAKGNQHAKKTIHSRKFNDEQVIELGKELVAWLKGKIVIPKPPEGSTEKIEPNYPIHLSEWFFFEKDLSYHEWDTLRKRECFFQYYDTALDLMAFFTQKNRKLDTAYGSRFIGVYSKDLRKHEREKKEKEIDYEQQVKSAASKNETPPRDQLLTSDIEAAKLRNENRKLKEQLNALQSKTRPVD